MATIIKPSASYTFIMPTSWIVDSKKGELYTNFQKQFDYFFNADIGYKNINEINQYYIPDEETKDSLQRPV